MVKIKADLRVVEIRRLGPELVRVKMSLRLNKVTKSECSVTTCETIKGVREARFERLSGEIVYNCETGEEGFAYYVFETSRIGQFRVKGVIGRKEDIHRINTAKEWPRRD